MQQVINLLKNVMHVFFLQFQIFRHFFKKAELTLSLLREAIQNSVSFKVVFRLFSD